MQKSVYTQAFKKQILAKALAQNAPRKIELAKEANIPYATLTTWITVEKKKNKQMSKISGPTSTPKSAEAKLKAVADTLDMTDEQKSAYCRTHGIYVQELESWKAAMLANTQAAEPKINSAEHKKLEHAHKLLKKELQRKEKALAEASALLVLKKKATLIWGDDADD